MNELILGVAIGFVSGVLVQRLYAAQVKGLFEIGSSWKWGKSWLFRALHRLYCEFCPRRLYCKRYEEEVKRG